MTNISPEPIILNDAVVSIEEDDYAESVSKAQLDPTTPVQMYRGMSRRPGGTKALVGTPTWMLTIDFPQDYSAATALSRYLLEHQGEEKEVILHPRADGIGYKVNVLIMAGTIGGAVDELAKATVQLPCSGQPVEVPAPTPTP